MSGGLQYLAALLLALVFLYSAVAKFRDAHPTRRALDAVGMPKAAGVAKVVPIIEVVVAVALIARPSVGAAAALAVLAVFTGFIAYLLMKKMDVSCGCFGANATRSVSSVDIVRNMLLAACAVLAMPLNSAHSITLEDFIAATTAVAIAAVVLTAISTRQTLGQLFDNRLPGER
jgi:hypothetical protein